MFLLTDGNQNPKKDRVTGEVLDPVKTSQPLIDRGIKIFAIGIGNDLDRRQLIAMTRNADRVKTVENAADLTTSDFIKSIASQTCKEGTGILSSHYRLFTTLHRIFESVD